MVKRFTSFSEAEKLQMVLHGTSYAMWVASSDKKEYEKFKAGKKRKVSNAEIRDIKILALLEGLGYPMEELGTYLYKDVITEIYEFLKGVSAPEDMQKCKELLIELNDGFSEFYHCIAREDKEMGVKSFHLYIQRAIERIDNQKINKELSKSIYGDTVEEMSYGVQAFQIAAYTLGIYSYDDVKEYKSPKIKKISNIPDNITLKDNF